MTSKNFDQKKSLYFFQEMSRIRHFELTAIKAKQKGAVLGAIHPSIGQEAVAVGLCGNLDKTDILLSTHRGHGHTLSKGGNPQSMMLELLGKTGGVCAGKGGSMHIADFNTGMLGANGVVGANINIAVGAAHAIKIKNENRIVVCIFGDGAVNRGPFLEGLNWAKIFDLAILFVCEDNAYAAMTKTFETTAGAGSVARAESLGITAKSIDGNDVLAVDQISRDYIKRTRTDGPHLLHLKTYRLSGHTSTDQASYRPTEELKESLKQDPIAMSKALLLESGISEKELDRIQKKSEMEMKRIFDVAHNAPFPPPEEAFTDVQDLGCPSREPF